MGHEGLLQRESQTRDALTRVEDAIAAKNNGEDDGVADPLPLDDEGAEDEQGGGNVDVVDVSLGEQRGVEVVRHDCGR